MSNDALRTASRSRYMPSIVYLLAVIGVGALVYSRNAPPSPEAARDLRRNQQLAAGDLETSNIKPLLGQYLKADVKRGKPGTEAMVDTKPIPARIASTMAAIVTMPKAYVSAQNIIAGSDVRICLKTDAFGDATKVLTVDCDELHCMVLVRLPKVPTQTVDPDILATARLVTDPLCGPKPIP